MLHEILKSSLLAIVMLARDYGEMEIWGKTVWNATAITTTPAREVNVYHSRFNKGIHLTPPPPAHNTRIKTLCQSCTTLCIWPSIYVRMKLNLASIGNNNTAVTLRARIAIVAQCERIIWPELKVEEQQHQDTIYFLTDASSCWNDNDLSAVISVVQMNSTTRVLFLTCRFVVPMRDGDVIGQRRRRHRQLTVLPLLLTTTIAWW